MTRVLVCRPKNYEVRYSINPWMQGSPVDRNVATKEFADIVEAYRGLGVHPEYIEQDPELPDMVFTANAGLMIDGVFYPSNFRYPERQRESKLFAAHFESIGIPVRWLDPNIVFEGAGDALYLGDKLMLGYGFRSMRSVADALQPVLGAERIISLGLSNPYFYHLDTCFSPLPSGKFVYFPDAFDDTSRALLSSMGGYWVTEEFCVRFGCNMVAIGDTILTSYADERLRSIAESESLRIVELPIGEYMKAGGGVRCLSFLF